MPAKQRFSTPPRRGCAAVAAAGAVSLRFFRRARLGRTHEESLRQRQARIAASPPARLIEDQNAARPLRLVRWRAAARPSPTPSKWPPITVPIPPSSSGAGAWCAPPAAPTTSISSSPEHGGEGLRRAAGGSFIRRAGRSRSPAQISIRIGRVIRPILRPWRKWCHQGPVCSSAKACRGTGRDFLAATAVCEAEPIFFTQTPATPSLSPNEASAAGIMKRRAQ
jgi:hypothetical protein